MSSTSSKQEMSMDDILASIRSYVSEGQTYSKNEDVPYLPSEEKPEKKSYNPEVIQLTDEIIPIETISIQSTSSSFSSLAPAEKTSIDRNIAYPNSQSSSSFFQSSKSTDNPFNRLQNEIVANTQTPTNLSSDELLSQLAMPLIKNWLDQNLRKIVEDIVEKEIERMRRS
jgi:cell pole-organizing protein PopZ